MRLLDQAAVGTALSVGAVCCERFGRNRVQPQFVSMCRVGMNTS